MPSEPHPSDFATDPERLLPGEDPASADPKDADHWISVYTRLLELKQQLLTNLRDMMAHQQKDVQEELERADVRLLNLEIERFEHRQAFWQRRQVSAGSGPAHET